MGLRVQGLGLRVPGFAFRVLGFRVEAFGLQALRAFTSWGLGAGDWSLFQRGMQKCALYTVWKQICLRCCLPSVSVSCPIAHNLKRKNKTNHNALSTGTFNALPACLRLLCSSASRRCMAVALLSLVFCHRLIAVVLFGGIRLDVASAC